MGSEGSTERIISVGPVVVDVGGSACSATRSCWSADDANVFNCCLLAIGDSSALRDCFLFFGDHPSERKISLASRVLSTCAGVLGLPETNGDGRGGVTGAA